MGLGESRPTNGENWRRKKGVSRIEISKTFSSESRSVPQSVRIEQIKKDTARRFSATIKDIMDASARKLKTTQYIKTEILHIEELPLFGISVKLTEGNDNTKRESILGKNSRVKDKDNKKMVPGFPYVLAVNRHTDLETLQAQKEYEKDHPDFDSDVGGVGTQYYFNESGAYKKVVTMPAEVAETREDLRTKDLINIDDYAGVMSFASPMLPEDFEVVGATLERMKELIDELPLA